MGPGFESPEVYQSAVPTPLTRPLTPKIQASPHDGEASEKGEGREKEKRVRVPSQKRGMSTWVSVFNAVGPPVPIPNTEVKRCSGENTWLATARENSSTLTQITSSGESLSKSVILTQWVHPFPFRTRKLSAAVAKILSWRRLGKIAHSRHTNKGNWISFPCFIYSSLAHVGKRASARAPDNKQSHIPP